MSLSPAAEISTPASIGPAGRPTVTLSRASLALFALAMGSFVIGTSEFASMGVLQLYAADLGLSAPQATAAITAYAIGVVVGAPLVTLVAARANRRLVLLGLMALFVVGNLLSSIASNLGWLMIARFVSGVPHGAYFGAGAVIASYVMGPGHGGKAFAMVMSGLTVATIFGSPLATLMGQMLGWRQTYVAVAGVGLLAFLAIRTWTPQTDALNGASVTRELSSLRKPAVWGVMLVAATGVAAIFAVYTFIGQLVTEVAGLSSAMIPVALALFGLGMTAGNIVGGALADRRPAWGIALGYAGALAVLAVLAIGGASVWILFPTLFGVGAAIMVAIPGIQVRLTSLAPEAPSLMGAMNLAALNVANALGAWLGGMTIAAGFGVLSTAWAGFALTSTGLLVLGVTLMIHRLPKKGI